MSDNQNVAIAKKMRERVAEQVRDSFADLIPEDEWKAMVDREITAFFEEPQTWDAYVNAPTFNRTDRHGKLTVSITPFRAMVWDEVQRLVSQQTRAWIQENLAAHMAPVWTNDGEQQLSAQLSPALEKKLEQIAPLIVAEFFKVPFAQAVMNMRSQLESMNTQQY